MYINIVPTIVPNDMNNGEKPTLKSVSIPELNWTFDQFQTRTPLPNKNFFVGSLKSKKSQIGFLVKTDLQIDKFTTIFEWDIGNGSYAIHKTTNIVEREGEAQDLLTQSVMLNVGMVGYTAKIYSEYQEMAPVRYNLVMGLKTLDDGRPARFADRFEKTTNENGQAVFIQEDTFHLQAIEHERLERTVIFSGRYPKITDAIEI